MADFPIDNSRMDMLRSARSAFRSVVILEAFDAEERRRLLDQLETSGVSCRLVNLCEQPDRRESADLDPLAFVEEFGERLSRLTLDEACVLRCVLDGMTNKAISRQLDSSMRTIDFRKSSLMKKLQVKSTAQLIREATMFETLTRHFFPDVPSPAEMPSATPYEATAAPRRTVPR